MNVPAPALLSVWIVDRAPNAAENVGSLLRNAGLRVRTRHLPDSVGLAQALTTDRPDVLVCPESNGPVSLEDIVARAKSCQPPIPVIALGDGPDSARIAAALARGAAQLVDRGAGELLAAVALREVALTQVAQQRLALEQEATQCRSQLGHFATHTSDAMAWVAEGIHLQVNSAYARLLGYDAPAALEGNPVMDAIAPASRDAVKRCLREAQQGRLPQEAIAITGRRADGSTFAMQWHLGWGQSGDQTAVQILIPAPPSNPAIEQELGEARAEGVRRQQHVAHLEQDLLRTQAQLADLQSRYAQLQAAPPSQQPTGPDQLAANLDRLAAQPVPATGSRFLLAVQLDELPELLPSVGYLACEAATQAYAGALQALLPDGGVAIRLRDFWVAAVYTAPNTKEAQTQAVRWQAQLTQQVVEVGAQSRMMRGIFGLREWPGDADDALESALLEAERAAQDARSARLQVGLARLRNPLAATQQADANWAEQLRRALTQNALRLVYQPISSLDGNAADYYEVRLRLMDELGQELSPTDFWPAAERTGIATELDRWVLSHALGVLDDQRGEPHQKGLFVKLSAASLVAADTVDWLKERLPKTATPAPLCLQIAEEQIESNLKSVLGLSQMMKERGYPLAIDHFGRSPHALQLASHLSPQFLKLAPGLLQEVTESEETQSRIRQIVEHAERHDIRVIAGHVENANALAVLWQLGVHYLQGHYVQEPEVVLRSPERTPRPPPQVQRA